jgi:hypothetical protein
VTEDIRAIVATCGEAQQGYATARCFIAFAAALRRSELAGLNFYDIEQTRDGLVVTLRRSNMDQECAGRRVGVPYGSRTATYVRFARTGRGSKLRGSRTVQCSDPWIDTGTSGTRVSPTVMCVGSEEARARGRHGPERSVGRRVSRSSDCSSGADSRGRGPWRVR